MATIKTSNGETIKYTNRVLYGQKPINKPIAFDNLVTLKNTFDKAGIRFLLIAGTLLGAVREHDFISHDEDIDLAFLIEDKQKVIDILPLILKQGFTIARYDRRNLLSVIRNNEYIDFYFFIKIEGNLRSCNGWLIPAKFLENSAMFDFKGVSFLAPYDYVEYLKYEYGETWGTPIKWFDYGISKSKWIKIYVKERVKEFLPRFVLEYIVKKKEKKFEVRFRKKIEKYQEIGGSIN